MNYLAHAYLSKPFSEDHLFGNMMGDFVKGNQYLQYNTEMQKGILMHRYIDSYTDHHPAALEAAQLFKPFYRLYSGALLDVAWDHFLANDTSFFIDDELKMFVQKIYAVLQNNKGLMPPKMEYMTGYMIQYNWLENYKQKEGLYSSWRGMSKRIEHLAPADDAIVIFEENYFQLQGLYQLLIKDLVANFKEG
jgi:acyl carrier protein phosphodiesterase